MKDRELGLRERKKRETRRQLSEIALTLFAERGFDQVKVADVAAAANVSEKTVFNYFPTKEDLILEGREEIEGELLRAVRERDEGVSVLAVARSHTLTVADRVLAHPDARRMAFRKVIQSTPSLHARMRQLSLRFEEELAELLTEETGASSTDPTPRVAASMIATLTRLAFGVAGWPPNKRRTRAETLDGIRNAFDLVERGLHGYAVR
ncbi:MAG: TetR family transcriptional regulator [Labilithrix sp.]|nr:TetR family transcriptional regulator [Labilithrix sp.]